MNNESRIKATIKSFTDLNAWKEGHVLALMIYEATKSFPKEEMFGLVSQIRRSAVSVTSNIAEGFSRQSYREKIQFYSVSQGSVTELQNQLLISRDVKFLTKNEFDEIALQSIKVHKIINGLIKSSRKIHDSQFVIRNS
jgi:four helix bundle protein